MPIVSPAAQSATPLSTTSLLSTPIVSPSVPVAPPVSVNPVYTPSNFPSTVPPVAPTILISEDDLKEEKSFSSSRKNFATRLFRKVFSEEERRGANCTGRRGKAKLDSSKLGKIREWTYQYFPLAQGQNEDRDWRENCVKAIDEANHRKKFKA